MDGKQLIQTLQTYSSYQQLTEYYIRKEIGKKYNTKRAKNDQLRLELDQLKKQIVDQSYLVNDVRLNIYQHLDIDGIINACYTDKYAVKLCSNKLFWDPIFVKYNLPISNNNYKHVKDWITAFTQKMLFPGFPKIPILPHSFYIYSMVIGFGIYFNLYSLNYDYVDYISRSAMNKIVDANFELDTKFKKLVLDELINNGKIIQNKQSFRLSLEFYKEIKKIYGK